MKTIDIGTQVKAKREALGLTQVALAGSVGVSQETISRIETGENGPAKKTAVALSRVLGLDLMMLLGAGR